MGYGYLLLDAMDPVEEVGDLAGDSVLRRTGKVGKFLLIIKQKVSVKYFRWVQISLRESGSCEFWHQLLESRGFPERG